MYRLSDTYIFFYQTVNIHLPLCHIYYIVVTIWISFQFRENFKNNFTLNAFIK